MELNQIFNTENIKTKPSRNRSTKKDLYKKEQENILNKINNIKDMGYLVFGKAIDIFRNDVKIRTTQYMIGKVSISL